MAVPGHLAQVRLHAEVRADTTRAQVKERLQKEINCWDYRAADLREQLEAGKTLRMNVDLAERRANELQARLRSRLDDLDRERTLRPLPPVVVDGAFVVPALRFSPPRSDAGGVRSTSTSSSRTTPASTSGRRGWSRRAHRHRSGSSR
jgi:hypothetical protein